MMLKAREGDIVETIDNNLFDVKGLVHPPKKIVAFIRYVPDPRGDRKRENANYRKVYPLRERYALLREHFPQYLVFDPVFDEELCEVPIEAVKRHFKPAEGLARLHSKKALDKVETDALEFAELLKKKANVSRRKLGISGSLLVGLHMPYSDVDPVIYGAENCRRVYSMLNSVVQQKDSLVKLYTLGELKRLFDFRSKDTVMSFEDFFTPCCYKIADVKILEGAHVEPIEEIASFRGRFCEQARNGETVIAQGKVERVQTDKHVFYRLLLGNKTSDFMVSSET